MDTNSERRVRSGHSAWTSLVNHSLQVCICRPSRRVGRAPTGSHVLPDFPSATVAVPKRMIVLLFPHTEISSASCCPEGT